MFQALKNSVYILVLLGVICGLVYPAAMTAASGALFPEKAAGSLLYKGNAPVGSALIAQNWTKPWYFQGRPSANPGGPDNAMTSGASNAGPTSLELVESVAERARDLRAANPQETNAIPQDLVTASGSGLDPDISPEGAIWQAKRIAAERDVAPEVIVALVKRMTETPALRILGEPRVNVLKINLELDRLYPVKVKEPPKAKKKAPKKRATGKRRRR